jgi:uncharacterized protein (TIGR03083 family)
MFTQVDESLVWPHIWRARSELREYLGTLSDAQWSHPSLCDGWLVRDVVAHLLLEYHYTFANSWKDFIASGLNVNIFMKNTAVALGHAPHEQLLERFDALLHEKHRPVSVSILNILVDLVVHEQDIRVPLGQSKRMRLQDLELIFSHWEPAAYNFGEKITGVANRVKNLEFVAADIGITKGKGAIVEGSAQDILLAITGRQEALRLLHGEGVAVLRSRLK